MSIKVEVCNKQSGIRGDYPCLKISREGRLVLFTEPKTGVFLAGEGHKPGLFLACWAEDMFTPLDGSVTLANEGCC